jgi:DNA mismatch endonuclease (patch repair protein)
MASVRNSGSVAERAVARRLWINGYRYRLKSDLPGKPDIVFPRQRVAIFIDGDFWHGNSWRVRGYTALAAQFNASQNRWLAKIERTITRDREVDATLTADGWRVLRYWESDVLLDPMGIANAIAAVVSGGRRHCERMVPESALELRRLRGVVPKATRELFARTAAESGGEYRP